MVHKRRLCRSTTIHPNAVTVDEEELIQALQEYFAEVLKQKKNVMQNVVESTKEEKQSRRDQSFDKA